MWSPVHLECGYTTLLLPAQESLVGENEIARLYEQAEQALTQSGSGNTF